mmetsp:Transcript_49860/g.132406  ORF Transcript_49860/g.132406 Transcript_49860/m.132406 type:complete len:231 (+) Transcript_49860:1256-1948(+)
MIGEFWRLQTFSFKPCKRAKVTSHTFGLLQLSRQSLLLTPWNVLMNLRQVNGSLKFMKAYPMLHCLLKSIGIYTKSKPPRNPSSRRSTSIFRVYLLGMFLNMAVLNIDVRGSLAMNCGICITGRPPMARVCEGPLCCKSGVFSKGRPGGTGCSKAGDCSDSCARRCNCCCRCFRPLGRLLSPMQPSLPAAHGPFNAFPRNIVSVDSSSVATTRQDGPGATKCSGNATLMG